MAKCLTCGKATIGYYKFCKECNELKEKGKILKCEDCGTWYFTKDGCTCKPKIINCLLCNKEAVVFLDDEHKNGLCRKHLKLLKNNEIIKCKNCGKWHYKINNCDCIKQETIKEEQNKKYRIKPPLTPTESDFWQRLKKIIGNKYIVTPQVALCSIIKKEKESFANELYRIIDFGIFTKEQYSLIALIEYNDASHFRPKRKERDEKVENILELAGLKDKLITFWTTEEYSDDEIKNEINKLIAL